MPAAGISACYNRGQENSGYEPIWQRSERCIDISSAIHGVRKQDHLNQGMKEIGTPVIRVVDCGDTYFALDAPRSVMPEWIKLATAPKRRGRKCTPAARATLCPSSTPLYLNILSLRLLGYVRLRVAVANKLMRGHELTVLGHHLKRISGWMTSTTSLLPVDT